jgi:hypothetical protein
LFRLRDYRRCFLDRRSLHHYRHCDRIGGCGVVSKAKEEAGFAGAGKRKRGADEALGDLGWIGEIGICGDGVHEVEAASGDGAGLRGFRWAVDVIEGGQADQGDERYPVSGCAIRIDCAQAERAEGGGAEGLERVQDAEQGLVVLEDEGAGGDIEHGMKRVVRIRDLESSRTREWSLRFERERKLLIDGKVIRGCEVNG